MAGLDGLETIRLEARPVLPARKYNDWNASVPERLSHVLERLRIARHVDVLELDTPFVQYLLRERASVATNRLAVNLDQIQSSFRKDREL